ncbi:MAG: hypothetical protein ABSF03_27980, partial [Streptosporangiaceae bacterium]
IEVPGRGISRRPPRIWRRSVTRGQCGAERGTGLPGWRGPHDPRRRVLAVAAGIRLPWHA